MERKKVLVFETSKTLMRAYELVLRGSTWGIIKVPQEARIFQAIESAAPDALIVERRALSPETREALYSLPLPIIYCAPARSDERAERLHLSRPFSSDDLFEALGTALAWEPDMESDAPAAVAGAAEEFDGDEEPMILPAPDDDDSAVVAELVEEEDDLPTPEITESKAMPEPAPEPAEAFVPSAPSVIEEHEVEIESAPAEEIPAEPDPGFAESFAGAGPAITEEPAVASPTMTEEPAMASPEPEPEMVVPAASDVAMPEPSFAEQIAEKVEERVVEELLPADADLPEGSATPDMIRAIIRRELREVMKEYFWEEAPQLMRQILEEEIRKLAAKQ